MKTRLLTLIIIAFTAISLNWACSNTEKQNTETQKDSLLTGDEFWEEQ